ncbi:hypothetical protein C8R42DRAFT_372918 [Lentinula raphanica]|nr:hypothetical protein C8R42DRAFT_372918 [Lentinula raphanica]KAJ3755387.1 hypothetical protein EV360DRAFT_85941 [Lentinula raphanica]
MSVTTPTLIPRPQVFPRLLPTLPHPPQTRPLPKHHSYPANRASLWTSGGESTSDIKDDSSESEQKRLVGIYGHLNARRNMQRELDDLSEEEVELEELNQAVTQRGFSFLVPIGKTLTVTEEKNDAAEEEESDYASPASNGPPSVDDDGDGDNDLDASMEDMDDSMNNDEDEEDNEDLDEEDLDDG